MSSFLEEADKPQKTIIGVGVSLLAGLVMYPIERVTYQTNKEITSGLPEPRIPTPSPTTTTLETRVTGHDWIWDVEAVAWEYMILEIVVIAVVLSVLYWLTS